MIIAVDAMGGDHAPQSVVNGAVLYCRENPSQTVLLVGLEDAIRRELKIHRAESLENLRIYPAASVISMEESPSQSVRRKRDASICVAMDLVKEGKADAVVSAGHTGAAVAAATLKLRLLEGIDRPGIGVIFPTIKGPTLLIDAGANIDPKPIHYYQYACMGEIYYRYIFAKKKPSIGILNVGEETSKGTNEIKEAHALMKQSRLNFAGNVEGRDIFNGKVDVVVCDGFVGNVVLKVAESISAVISRLLKDQIKKSYLAMLGAFLSQSAFRSLKREIDYSEYGGAPLLGVKGVCIICHGSSNPTAIKNAIRVAVQSVKSKINDHILAENQSKELDKNTPKPQDSKDVGGD